MKYRVRVNAINYSDELVEADSVEEAKRIALEQCHYADWVGFEVDHVEAVEPIYPPVEYCNKIFGL